MGPVAESPPGPGVLRLTGVAGKLACANEPALRRGHRVAMLLEPVGVNLAELGKASEQFGRRLTRHVARPRRDLAQQILEGDFKSVGVGHEWIIPAGKCNSETPPAFPSCIHARAGNRSRRRS